MHGCHGAVLNLSYLCAGLHRPRYSRCVCGPQRVQRERGHVDRGVSHGGIPGHGWYCCVIVVRAAVAQLLAIVRTASAHHHLRHSVEALRLRVFDGEDGTLLAGVLIALFLFLCMSVIPMNGALHAWRPLTHATLWQVHGCRPVHLL